MKKSVLREYARLVVRVGVNIQKGQDLQVYADLDQPEFVQMVVEEAYKAILGGLNDGTIEFSAATSVME